MERRTRSGKHQVTEDRVNVKTFANTNVPQKNLKEPKRTVTSSRKQEDKNLNKEPEAPKSLNKIAVRRTSKRVDREVKPISRASTDEKNQTDEDRTVKPIPKRDISNSRLGQEIPQYKEKGILSKAFINDSNNFLNVHEFPVTEEPRSSLSTTSHVSDRNLLSDDLSTKSPENEEDSFLYEITSRSPAKPVPRTEDSIPALVTDLKASHEIALPGDINECQKLREPPPHLVYTSKSDSLDKHNCILSINPCLKSPTKNDTYDLVKETAQQGLCNSLQVKKTEKSQTSRVSSTKSPDQSLKSLKRLVCKSKSSVTICSPIRSHSTHPSHIRPTKVDSETLGVNSHRKVVTKSRTTPNTSMSSVDVFTRLSKRTPKYHSSSSSSSSKTNNSTLHISKETKLSSSTSSVARDGNSSLNNSKASKEELFGAPHRQSAVWSDEAKPLTLQKPKINSNFVKSPSKKIPSRNIPAPHHQIKILKQHHKTKPLEDIKQNSLPRVNPPQDIKTGSETKINTVLLVRTEAAKRGRQAIQEWAEKQMAKS